ncbi:hypothetical protein A3H89_00725 [Candidatus Amesbacteria bacterium RIFCSPLOWO2_02_FULL_48_11]|uniref:Cell division protein FtsX n=4 Tax=Candidatus Amesiibacteriota TaxID=1752730 RepID=A0A1F4Z5F3_9BACT|nr:MAG: Cell division protein [Candidatus Amesbacteria bacterium GW2011_GWA2_47_11]KKU90882.1 MAG: Cell division protein [Candidatus Amesbacteria bacterium GW2011_GWC1_48_10]KKW00203.1 MAG: Cell division protein [Candidatus Amesbacteria bacterium GW2011_GWA1_48_9]OGC90462.1 MAG: hypothetical protein A2V48_02465 [Candidatus Amesbacteria bacterium RBG_19FT_COMBO_48_16]OGC95929.1 MAG: hypothetical protein A3C34_02000 [Candidatus Amesbacteria bacterium RIFCSPHIGHO2_02_FULL_48_21]OGC98843.1 MAG: hy
MISNHFHVTWTRLRRTPYQTLVSLMVVTLTLFSATIFFLDAAAAHKILRYFESRPQVNAFFKTDVIPNPQQIDLIRTRLEATGLVESFKFISKDEALKIYRDLNASDPLLLEAVTAAMLPASLEVSAKNPSDLKLLAEQLKQAEGIEEVRFEENVVFSLIRWTKSVRTARIALSASQAFITFVVILSVITARVTSRREEIAIYQLLGATAGYISYPFVLEGVLYGAIGAASAWLVTYLVFLYSTPFLSSFIFQIPELYPSVVFMLEVLGGELILGSLIGGLGGLFAARRFLRS